MQQMMSPCIDCCVVLVQSALECTCTPHAYLHSTMAKQCSRLCDMMIYKLLEAESSDEDDVVENDSDDGGQDDVEGEDHASDT